MFRSKKDTADFSRFMRIPSLMLLLALALGLSGPPAARAQSGGPSHQDLQYFRSYHTATTLADGQVLVTGGYGVPAYNPGNTPARVLNVAEIYNPATGIWTITGSLKTAREYHTATLLPNGQVLVAGGDDGSFYLKSVELYDPVSRTWTEVGSLITPRADHTASPLANGKILMAGGRNGSYYNVAMASNNAEVFDPQVFRSTLVPNLNTPRVHHTAVYGGQVVGVMGGYDNNGNLLSSYEAFDGDQGIWVPQGASDPKCTRTHAYHTGTLMPSNNGTIMWAGGNDGVDDRSTENLFITDWYIDTQFLFDGRRGHSATLLRNGKVMVAGGWNKATGDYLFTTEVYDPQSKTWKYGNFLSTPRAGHTATLLANGGILIAGGFNATSDYLGAEFYYPDQGFWFWDTDPGNFRGRDLHTATLLPNGKVLVAGGYDGTASMSSAQLYTDDRLYGLAGTWNDTAPLNPARAFHTATLLPCGLVLVVGGAPNDLTVLGDAQLYDPDKRTWRSTLGLKEARKLHSATLLADGKVLVTGGVDSGHNALASSELYDPATGRWSQVGSLHSGRIYHTATLLYNGQVLVAGGYDATMTDTALAELYDPASRTWSLITAPMLTPRDEHTATLLPNGRVLVAGGWDNYATELNTAEIFDPILKTWTATGNLHNPRINHSATLLPDGLVLVAGGRGEHSPDYYPPVAELYDPATGIWIQNDSLTMESPRYRHTATLLNSGNVLVVGGVNSAGIVSTYSTYTNVLGLTPDLRPQITSVQVLPPLADSRGRSDTTDPGFCLGISLSGLMSDFMKACQLTQEAQVQILSVEDKHAIITNIDPSQSSPTYKVTDVIHGAANDIYQVTLSIGGIPSYAFMIKVGTGPVPPYISIVPTIQLLMD
jgi:N-acetylneuraminic acid mutarotase